MRQRLRSAVLVSAMSRYLSLSTYCAGLVIVFIAASFPAIGQVDPSTETAPPPVRVMSKDERTILTRELDVKARTVLALNLMTARIASAEKAAAAEDFEKMFTDLGGFQGILDNTLDFLSRSNTDSDKVLGNFKRFEIGLRSYVPRIEIMRRELSPKYEPYVKSVIKYIRDSRTRALEPLFGDSVVREPRQN